MTDRFNDNTVFRGGQLPDVSRFARYGKLRHEDFIDEIRRQNENREDFIIEPGQVRFEGLNFKIGDRTFPLDPVAMTTLAERFKLGGSQTVTRRGLVELMLNDPATFESTANLFLRLVDKPMQFRTLYGTGIAFPSQLYTRVNHVDLMEIIFDTLRQVLGVDPSTKFNYMDKSICYSFIPIVGMDNILIRNFKGYEDRIGIGVEVRNSEILENAVTVKFKLIRYICENGHIFADEVGSVYQRHISLTTQELLSNVQVELLKMFQENLDGLYASLETMKKTLELTVSNGEAYTREFGKMLDLDNRTIDKMIEVAHIEEDNSLYGWTIGPLSYIASNRTGNRFAQANGEEKAGLLLSDPTLKERLLSLVD